MDAGEDRRERWNARYAERELVWSAGPNATLVEVLTSLALTPGRALDLGCGEGRNAIWLAEAGWRVIAVDFSDVGIDKGRQIAERRGVDVDWQVADVASWRAPEASVDLAVALFLQTDADERARWMANALEALKPGGVFIYIGHDLSNLEHGRGGPQSPEVLATPAGVSADLSGCRIIDARVIERPVETDPGHGDGEAGLALDTLVVAAKLE